MEPRTLTRTLHVDAAANAAAGAAVVAAAGWLAGPFGIGAGWLRLAGAALLVYAVENLLVARRPAPAGLAALVAADVAFAVAVFAVAAADLTGAETWARWLLAATGDVALAAGVAKAVGLRSLRGRAVGATA